MDSSILEFGLDTNRGLMQSKIKNRIANSANPDEMAHYKQYHLDLHCLHRYWFCWAERVTFFFLE